MAADHRGLTVSCLVLRLVSVSTLAVSLSLIVTDTVSYSFDPDTKIGFKNIIGYRFVLATSSIGLLYTMLQIPVTIFLLCTQQKTKSVTRLIEVSMYGDKVISFLLATGVGAGFLVSIDVRRLFHELETKNLVVEEVRFKIDKYVKKAIISTSLLLVGSVSMVMTSIIFFLIRISAKTKGGFFG